MGASLRVIGLFGTALGFLGTAATVGLAARITGIATSIWAVTAAASVGAVARVRALAAGMIALGTVGGASAVLAAVGGSILALGRAVLLFPLVALRGIGLAMWGLVANPVGATSAGIVTALAALGLWVTNNWGGIKEFFSAFGAGFTKGLGPEASGAVEGVVTALKSAWEWVSKLLGPIDETGAKWRSWGESAGAGVAAVVTALSGLPSKIGELAKQGFDALVNFEWSKAGGAIVNSLASAGGRLVDAVRGLASRAVSGVAGALGLGGAASAGAPFGGAPAVAGARALGGPVTGGLPYFVGERGPESFVPETSGRIETNGVPNSLSRHGGQATSRRNDVKTGVPFLDLAPAATVQGFLFIRLDTPQRMRLIEMVDGLNRWFGRDRVRFACSGIERGWSLKAEFLSQRYTTRWGELLTI